MKLAVNAFFKFIFGIIFIGALLFVPAGTLKYYNGWLFLGILFIPMLIFGIILFIKDKDLLKKRINAKEKINTQKIIISLFAIIFILTFVLSGFNFRYNWIKIPNYISIIASIVLFISYILYIEVVRENKYLSRTIEVQKNQEIIDTGLYSIVRHPMYLSATLLFLSIPLVLNFLYGFIISLIFPILFVIRINNEEKYLEKNLKGYNEYKKKTKYRLIPFIW